jgi:hypothetical protein
VHAPKAGSLQLDAQLLRAAMAELARAHRAQAIQGPVEIHLPVRSSRVARWRVMKNMLRRSGGQ